jgi:signal peptidase I
MRYILSEFCCLILLILSLLTKCRFIVRGNSMLPRYNDADKFIINRFTYLYSHPKRGDIVCFKANWGLEKIYLKRIVGLPGESIKCTGKNIYINGKILHEDYVITIHLDDSSNASIWTLGNSEYFVLGDNRATNFDSRRFGPITKKDLIGPTYHKCF